MWLILMGILLMLGGVLSLLGMISGFMPAGLLPSLLAFLATLGGMVLGLAGIGRRLQQRKPPGGG
jgi:hypothetical protein